LLNEKEVLEALGVDYKFVQNSTEGVWPTVVPDLNYIKSDGNSYFKIKEKTEDDQPENLSDWNKSVWAKPDADEKANRELTEEFGEKPSEHE